MPKPTKDDAMLILQLDDRFPSDAFKWFATNFSARDYDEFIQKHPKGGEEYENVRRLLRFYELAGTLDYYGLLSEDLFFDHGFGFWWVWEKMEPVVLGWQKAIKDEFAWDTTRWFATRMKAWWKKHPKPKTTTASKRHRQD